MNFDELIDTLSKGSATAVTTLESNVAELNDLQIVDLSRFDRRAAFVGQ